MDAGDLKVFEAVARLGGMNRAAQELHTVQSNVTARVRQLEQELGAALFDRNSRGVALTAAGRRLLPYAERVRLLLAEARRVVADDGQPNGPLTIGSLETTAGLRLPALLANFARRHPAVDLSLVTGTTCELVDAVLAQRVEGAFVCGPVSHPELDEHSVFSEELVVITAPGVRDLDQLLGRGQVKLVMFRAGCSYRQRFETWLAQRGIVGIRVMEFGTVEGILGCVGAGIGVSLLPAALVTPSRRDGRIATHPLPAGEGQVETVFIRRRDAYVSSALASFLDMTGEELPRAEAAE